VCSSDLACGLIAAAAHLLGVLIAEAMDLEIGMRFACFNDDNTYQPNHLYNSLFYNNLFTQVI